MKSPMLLKNGRYILLIHAVRLENGISEVQWHFFGLGTIAQIL